MSWLTPGMLAVALIAAVPLWIHLASRPPPATHTVASVMFLRAHDLSVRHHRRVRDRVLLLLRTLILLALAIALAQPHLDDTDNTLAMQDLPTVVVLDRSASMQIGSRWNAAQAEAERIIRTASRLGADVALLSFSSKTTTESGFTKRFARMTERLRTLAPVAVHGTVTPAILRATQMLAEHPHARGRIVVITDGQPSGLSVAAPITIPDSVDVVIHKVPVEPVRNLSVMQFGLDEEPRQLRAVIKNTGDVAVDDVPIVLTHESHVLLESRVSIASGETQTIQMLFVASPDATALVSVRTADDDFAYDNKRSLLLEPHPVLRVATLDHHPLVVPARVVLQAARRLRFILPGPVHVNATSSQREERAFTSNRPTLWIIDPQNHPHGDDLTVPAEATVSLRKELSEGALVLVWPGSYDLHKAKVQPMDTKDGDPQPTSWWPEAAGEVIDGTLTGSVTAGSLAQFNAALRVARWSGLALTADTGDRVLARWQDGRPAVLIRSVGRGQVLVVGVSLSANQHASVGVGALAPLILAAIADAANLHHRPGSYRAGALVRLRGTGQRELLGQDLNSPFNADALTVLGPDNKRLHLGAGQALFAPDKPGLYQAWSTGSADASSQERFWVDIDPAEAELRVDSEADLRRAIITQAELGSPDATPSGEPLTRPLWPWFIALALVAVLLESALAAHAARPDSRPA